MRNYIVASIVGILAIILGVVWLMPDGDDQAQIVEQTDETDLEQIDDAPVASSDIAVETPVSTEPSPEPEVEPETPDFGTETASTPEQFETSPTVEPELQAAQSDVEAPSDSSSAEVASTSDQLDTSPAVEPELEAAQSDVEAPTESSSGQIEVANASLNTWTREGWSTDFTKINVEPSEILDILPRDQIPSIDDPKFMPVGEETDIPDREPVISLVINGDARAYPLRIMMWHEIANDTVGGVPVSVTYCPLCNAAIVFDATVDGAPVEFGTTGKLRNSDLVMYDRTSQTWWQQFSGEGLVGKYAGETLTMIPSQLDSWGRFKEDHPDGQVLVPSNDQMRSYWLNPYDSYDTAARPFLYNGPLPTGIPAMERVVMVRGEQPVAIAVSLLEREGTVRDGDIVLTWEAGQASALDTSKIADGRDVGNVSVTRTVDGVEEPVVHDVTFAFVVNAFEPTLSIRTE